MNFYPYRATDRQPFYGASALSKRFSICDQTAPPASYTAQTSFIATTPTFMLFKPSGSTVKHVLSNVELGQTGTIAGGGLTILVALDSANRYSAGGTLIVPKCTNISGIGTAITDLLVRANPTATAAGAGTVYTKAYPAVAQIGSTIKLDFLDGVILPTLGSLLIYVFAATTGPTLWLNADVIEEPVRGI